MAEATEEKTEKVEIPKKFEGLVKEIDKMSVLELSELVKVLENHHGVSAAAPMAAAAAPAAADGHAAPEPEKDTPTLVLTAPRDQKINVTTTVREITLLGL